LLQISVYVEERSMLAGIFVVGLSERFSARSLLTCWTS